VVVLALLAPPVLGLMVCTGQDERRRGSRAVTAVAAGLFFPLAWVAWYVRDEYHLAPVRAPSPEL
jgi:hypothetical protein